MTTGMLLGKFMPPHLGHVYLGEFAARFVDHLTIVVGSLEREPIPGELRFRWMQELFPFANVVHLTDELPQEPAEHPDFWNIWRTALLQILPSRPDYVFASERYGWRLAEELGAVFVPVDGPRSAVPVSGTAIRTDPAANWAYIPRCVRPYFLRRVCVFGPESTGKTTLARKLADHFATAWVPEYARTLLEAREERVRIDDMELIARGQAASEDALARNANRVLITDTDPLATLIWSDVLFGTIPPQVRKIADSRAADLYLLMDADAAPWVADPIRYLPDGGRVFFERCRAELDARGRRYVVIQGDWDERFRAAVAAIEAHSASNCT
jgi:NadR type nicotinamide-nucleotide adenylyltransferase